MGVSVISSCGRFRMLCFCIYTSSALPLTLPCISCESLDADCHTGASMKLLTCAECDLGPLGWNEVGGKEFWLAAARVAYRQ